MMLYDFMLKLTFSAFEMSQLIVPDPVYVYILECSGIK